MGIALSVCALALPAGLITPAAARGVAQPPLTIGKLQPGTLTPAQVQQFSQDAHTKVIVILRDQQSNLPPTPGVQQVRALALAAAQAPIVAELRQVQAPDVRPFKLINAVAAIVSPAEEAHLAANPLVQAVVPDATIRAPRHPSDESDASAAGSVGIGAAAAPNAAGASCNTLEPQALQLTNAAFADSDTPQAQQVRDGNGKEVTGKGVTVAYIADGLDPNIAGFLRPDGSHVFVDYQDFSGDPVGTATDGAEAFGDASSIAAQDRPNGSPLTFDISQFVAAAHPLPAPCNIRIRGMAPGASLVGLKVFSNLGFTTTSDFVQAIEWAVLHDHVDVLNESFGSNPFPDNANDPISLADNAAVRAGVTVVVSSGDAGTAGTLGSPATDSNVISVGATTQYRLYAQTGNGAIVLGSGGYLDNNISSFSSGGFAQRRPRTVDVVAPGELGWALYSIDTSLYTGCTSLRNAPSPIETFGGTSESAPLTAGAAALVIQAYRSTHDGANPAPVLVKQIIMSTATDLGAPAYEQGAGLIDALKAVYAALSVRDENGSPRGRGNGMLVTPNSAAIVAAPNAQEIRSFTITNTGSRAQLMVPRLQTLGPPIAGENLTLHLDPATDPTFLSAGGSKRAYVEQTFRVPAGAQHLDAAIAFQTQLNPAGLAYISLFDPSGRLAAYSVPQGVGNGYGHVDVVRPAAGTWTAAVFVRASGPSSYTGPVQFSWSASRYVTLGFVFPPVLVLPGGASRTIRAIFTMPSQPGDLSAAIRFGSFEGQSDERRFNPAGEIPVTLRTLIPLGPAGGSFAGMLTGGNGRAGAGPTMSYAFDVPDGLQNISLAFTLPDSGYNLEGLLIDPQGMELDVQSNIVSVDSLGNPTAYGNALQFFRYNPQPGRWQFVLLLNSTASGNQTSIPFTAAIGFNTAKVAAPGLPNNPSVSLPAGKPVTIPVAVTNTGAVTEQYFADARLPVLAVQPLLALFPTQGTLPGFVTEFIVPTEASSVVFAAQAAVPINMDAFNAAGAPPSGQTGSPDLFAVADPQFANTVVATLDKPELPFGPWVVVPSEIGPYGPAGAPSVPVATGAAALIQPFDPAVSADSGDIWADLTLNTNTYKPLVLAPGQSGTINVTITPDPSRVGTTVSGYLYVDTFSIVGGSAIPFNGDEVVRILYSYTVAPAS